MKSIKLNYLSCIGMVIGIVIMAFSLIVFCYNVDISSPYLERYLGEEPEYELDLAYGGDAYTGMQQASAQAANNLIPIFNVVENLDKNMVKQIKAETDNTSAVVSVVKLCFGFLLLSIGLLTTFKHAQEFLTSVKKNEENAAIVSEVDMLNDNMQGV